MPLALSGLIPAGSVRANGPARYALGLTAALTAVALACLGVLASSLASAATAVSPNLVKGSAYLVAPANLIDGHFYESFPGYADFGMTIDGAFALAATGDENPALKGIVTFLDDNGKDPKGNTVSTWTGIGTSDVSGGSVGDEALLAEAVGYSPRDFSGHNLIAALNASVCTRASTGSSTRCAAAGNYSYSYSVFDQTLGIMAQLRAGQASEAASPIRYLESLRNSDGSFPSLIPDSHDQDVDSTAMAVMALALAPGATAAADVTSGMAWIASKQETNGGFPGTAGESVNSAGLAIQGLTLEASRYRSQIRAALAFLAHEQNSNGGFNVAASGQRGSNVRASTQALGGAAGTSFGTLHRNLSTTSTPTPSPTVTRTVTPAPAPAATVTVTAEPSASRTSSPEAAPPATSPPPPVASPGTDHGLHRAFTDVSSDSAVVDDLWWAVLAVAVVAAIVIGLLFVRRRRLYPPGSGGRTGALRGGSS